METNSAPLTETCTHARPGNHENKATIRLPTLKVSSLPERISSAASGMSHAAALLLLSRAWDHAACVRSHFSPHALAPLTGLTPTHPSACMHAHRGRTLDHQGAPEDRARMVRLAGAFLMWPGEASLLSHRGGGDAAASQVMESFYSGFGRGLGKYWDHFSWGNVPGGFLVGVPKEPMSFPWPPRGGGECSLQLQALFTATHDGHHWSVQAQAPPPVDKAVGLSRTLPSKAPP